MYIITKYKKLKRMGNIYKEEVIEKHYKKAVSITVNPKMALIKYREMGKDNTNEIRQTEYMALNEIVDIEVVEE